MGSSSFHNKVLAFLLISLIQFLLSNFSFANAYSGSTEEAHALLTWKTSLHQNHSRSLLSSWNLDSVNATSISPNNRSKLSSPCSWFGIRCKRVGGVLGINLSTVGLKGTLHEFSFSSFPHLVYLDLSANEFSGIIPAQIANLTKLKYLNLSANRLFGEMPPEIGQLSSLNGLSLSSNYLNGSIPASVGNLSGLILFYLHNNSFSGSIPPIIGNLKFLSSLALSTNHLNGVIPPSIGNLTNLNGLYLFKNSLSGTIPPSIGNLKNLRFLALQTNKLSGSIPIEIGNLKFLSGLVLGNNSLSGLIPLSLGNLSNLAILSLQINKLFGSIPQEIGNLMKLSKLKLAKNQLTGSLPYNICQSGSLERFFIRYNYIEGPIPKSLRNCTSLVRARLEWNNLSGNISEDFGIYPNLKFIDLSHNKFYGEISSNWGKCPKLATLNISMNNITGNIPLEFANSSQLQVLDLSSNHIVGEIPVEFGKLISLGKLILNSNKLSGSLPRELGSLTKLEYLDLSKNRLSNSIPKSLGYLLKLHYLDLGNNQFSQEIPTELQNLVQLSKLDLSYNLLKGEIPSQICNLESLENLKLSHNNLSGLIPNCFERMYGLSNIDISYNELQGPIPNSTTFQDASIEELQGNKGLCGNVKGLPSCNVFTPHKQSFTKNWLVIIIPVPGALCAVIVMFLAFKKWKRDSQKQEDNYVTTPPLLSVLTFEGRILHEEIICATNNFDIMFCIGEGGQGDVYKAELSSGDIIAVKKFHSPLLDKIANQQEFFNEIKALTEIRHRNIVKFYGFCSHIRHSFLVYEYLERGSLAAILSNEEAIEQFDWKMRMNVIKSVADALSYMHHDCFPPIVHRDISSKNVLLDLEYEARVSDFGIAKFLQPDSSNCTELAGTCGYIAPELVYTMKVSEKCDVYSFGVLALEVIKGKHPTDFLSTFSTLSSNINIALNEMLDPRLPTPSINVQDKLISIMEVAFSCLHESPECRPTMQKVCQLLQI